MTVTRFEVNIPEAVLDDLRERLGRTRWPDEVDEAGWDYGTNLGYLRQLAGYWRDEFDWSRQERAINEFAQFRAEVDGVGIHFVHERGTGENPLPLLLLHGWPSSFLQMLKIIPLLTDPEIFGGDPADSFDVIVPSPPGYGFSDRPTEGGMSVGRIEGLFTTLLTEELGYDRYAIRAGDLGAGVAPQMAMARPGAVVALHMSGSSPFVDKSSLPGDLSPAEQQMVEDTRGAGRVGRREVPRAWSDCGGDVERAFTRDELLTNLTVYWATETIGSSVRLYYESMRDQGAWGEVPAPTALAMLPADMFHTPREWVERNGPVTRWTDLPRGGHFGKQEVPDLLADDLRAFPRPLRRS